MFSAVQSSLSSAVTRETGVAVSHRFKINFLIHLPTLTHTFKHTHSHLHSLSHPRINTHTQDTRTHREENVLRSKRNLLEIRSHRKGVKISRSEFKENIKKYSHTGALASRLFRKFFLGVRQGAFSVIMGFSLK